MENKILKLYAKDAEDVQVMASVLQDSIAPVCDMAYSHAEKNFVMVVHRFCWDYGKKPAANEDGESYERICCAVDIGGVESVQLHGFEQNEHGRMLDLLTITLEKDSLNIIFAGDAALKLGLSDWNIRLEDFGEPWPTQHMPRHAT